MKHPASNELLSYWLSVKADEELPPLSAFQELLPKFKGAEAVFRRIGDDIIYDQCGKSINEVAGVDLTGKSISFVFPEAMKKLQVQILLPCFEQKIGVVRHSRYLYGHRHKDAEWCLLPVGDDATGETLLLGQGATFVDIDPRDHLSVGSDLLERIITQNYLSLGRKVRLDRLSGKCWAFLDTMGTKVAIDGEEVDHTAPAILGEAAMLALKVGRSNVLAAMEVADFGRPIKRIANRYHLKLVESGGEALAILETDKVDVLVAAEQLGDMTGLELIERARALNQRIGFVLIVEPRDGAGDTCVQIGDATVHCLVRPLGEFALRQAIDEAATRLNGILQREALAG
ncbi:hypothetical protein [Pseudokordiimonas caeni]|uniref:hypothetical protein n=1 Tax=Pseudokordiimonas caeni TaxID=2997908 RepID=UPI002811531A|nr:hypothetical protein [Pseudokordiimonas caeni]